MRIAFDHEAFTMQAYGGISRYHCRLAQELSSMAEQPRIFAPMHRNRHLREMPAGIVYGLYCVDFPPASTRIMSLANAIASARRLADWRPEILHVTYYGYTRIPRCRCPTVVTVHDMIHELFPTDFSWHDRTAKAKREVVQRADCIICVSENTRRDLVRILGVDETRTHVVHHGWDPLPTLSERQAAPSGGHPYILFVGQRSGYKNFAGMLRGVALSRRLMRDISVVAFGGGPFSHAERALITSLRFREGQVLHRSGDDLALGSAYANASALVYPSLYEGFGIPPLEAMGLGCPVISSHASSMPEVVGDAAEYFDPTAEEDIRGAIEAVMYSVERHAELRRKGHARVAEFSWQRCAKQTLQVYRSVC